MLAGFCERLVAAGCRCGRARDGRHAASDPRGPRHPLAPRRAETAVVEYGRTNEGEVAENWRRSTFYQLVETGETDAAPPDRARRRWRILRTSRRDRDEGMTDFVAVVNRFGPRASSARWTASTRAGSPIAPDGFTDAEIAALRAPGRRSWRWRSSASRWRASPATLVETYLGRDAGQRVLGGRIARGVADRIEAVLWFSDLRGYTRITDTAPPEQIIPLLNDYAEVVISAIREPGRRRAEADRRRRAGDLPRRRPREACAAALDAARGRGAAASPR